MGSLDQRMKRRNKLAKDLEDKHYHQRVIPNKKKRILIQEQEEALDEELEEFFDETK